MLKKIISFNSLFSAFRILPWVIDYFRNRRKEWSLYDSGHISLASEDSTSITDVVEYTELCALAVKENSVFDKFRSCKEYREVLDHVSFKQGHGYLNQIRVTGNSYSKFLDVAKNQIGSPFTYWYRGVGRISPTNLRYAKVSQDLENLFGTLDHFNIKEIGVGFGGQCSQILKLWKVEEYAIFDLDPVLELTKKFLDRQSLLPKVTLGIFDKETQEYDLVISNYAFSEIRRSVQEQYFTNVIAKAKRGYITFNEITPPEWKSFTSLELSKMIPGAEILQEIPLTHPGNSILVWGHQPLPR